MRKYSKEGSLYSMRSCLSPRSALSASSSAPASTSHSLHSRGFTGNNLKSLAHFSSVSSIAMSLDAVREKKCLHPSLLLVGTDIVGPILLIYPSPNLDLISQWNWRAIDTYATTRSAHNCMSITTTGMMGSSVDAQVNNGRDYRQGGVLVIACGMGYGLRATMTMKRQCSGLVALHIIMIVINPLQSKPVV
jgi:hypothetical protein